MGFESIKFRMEIGTTSDEFPFDGPRFVRCLIDALNKYNLIVNDGMGVVVLDMLQEEDEDGLQATDWLGTYGSEANKLE